MEWSSNFRSAVRRNNIKKIEITGKQRVILAALKRGDGIAADHLFDSVINGDKSLGLLSPLQGSSQVAQRMLLLQPVGDRCNLACAYCYENDRRRMTVDKKMSIDVLTSILNNVLPFVTLPFSIFIHGGEPLLAGKDFFRKIANLVKSFPNGEDVVLGVQTNGILIDREWVDIFRKYNYRIGLSLDGPQKIHDQLRTRQNGKGSYSEVIDAIQLLQKEKIPFGAISVLSAAHLNNQHSAKEIFDHFVSLGINHFDVHPAYSPSPGNSEFNVSPKQYAEFMIDLFERWIEYGDKDIQVRSIEHFFQAMAGTSAEVCYRAGKCTSIMGVRCDGTAIPCTRPFDSSYTFGNLVETPLPSLQSNKGFTSFVEHESKGRNETTDCKWSSVCGQGGCPHERESNEKQDITGRHVYCTCVSGADGGYPSVYNYYSKRIEEILIDSKNSNVNCNEAH